MVSLIRDDDQPAGLEPAPDVAALEGLVAAMDVPTTLRVEGDERPAVARGSGSRRTASCRRH